DYEDMIDMGARIQQVQGFAAHVSDQDCYRQGDYDRLVSRVQQLEKMLPLQTYSVCLPYQYELPGSELFSTGNVHLRPVLRDFYGLHYVSTKEEASVFLTGRNFHPTLTHVIAGGKESHSVPDVDKEGQAGLQDRGRVHQPRAAQGDHQADLDGAVGQPYPRARRYTGGDIQFPGDPSDAAGSTDPSGIWLLCGPPVQHRQGQGGLPGEGLEARQEGIPRRER